MSNGGEGKTRKNIVCPQCSKDDRIEKLSAIVSAGVQAMGGEVVGAGSLQGVMVSKQATRLAPPAEPKKPQGLHWFIWVVGLLVVVACGGTGSLVTAFSAIAESSARNPGLATGFSSLITCGFPLAVFVGLFILHNNLKKKDISRHEVEFAAWQAKMSVWDKLYYCARDDIVFDPEIGETAKPESIATLLS
jgi:hypothetical protein